MTFEEVVEIELFQSGGTIREISGRLNDRVHQSLKRMVDQGIVHENEQDGRSNEKTYTLTPIAARKFKR